VLQTLTLDPIPLASPPSDWLWYGHSGAWHAVALPLEHRQALLLASRPSLLVLAEIEPLDFISGILAALSTDTPLLLANPLWQAHEWQQVATVVPRDYQAWGAVPPLEAQGTPQDFRAPMILIPTGGSQGRLRWAMHTLGTLYSAVQGVQQHLQVSTLHCLSILPLYHVSGLMPVLRSLWTGGQLYVARHLRDLQHAPMPPNSDLWLSLVPRQLHQVCDAPIPWLQSLAGIFIGGGATWNSLLDTAERHRLPLCLSYGMTETAGMVCAQKAGDFLRGDRSCGSSLPHAHLTISTDGTIDVQATSLARGYYPNPFGSPVFRTDDRGEWHGDRLYIWGRASRKIISGGENIYPEELESLLLSSGWVKDIYIYGEPHPTWGEQVVAAYVPVGEVTPEQLEEWLRQRCSAYKCPKRWLSCTTLPRTPQGKIRLSAFNTIMRRC